MGSCRVKFIYLFIYFCWELLHLWQYSVSDIWVDSWKYFFYFLGCVEIKAGNLYWKISWRNFLHLFFLRNRWNFLELKTFCAEIITRIPQKVWPETYVISLSAIYAFLNLFCWVFKFFSRNLFRNIFFHEISAEGIEFIDDLIMIFFRKILVQYYICRLRKKICRNCFVNLSQKNLEIFIKFGRKTFWD